VGLAAVWVVGVGPVAWLLRDGLGSDAVETTGWSALSRALHTFAWGPIALVLVALAVVVTRRRGRK
jgi:hypothetical protein